MLYIAVGPACGLVRGAGPANAGGRAGLKRVEVFVHADRVDSLKAYAAQLREGSEA